MEKRKNTIQQIVSIVEYAFLEMFYYSTNYNEEYYLYRLYEDNTFIAVHNKSKTFWKGTWAIDENNNAAFSEKSTWEEVEEEYIPTGEIGARNVAPVKNSQNSIEKRIATSKSASSNGNGMKGLGIVVGSRTMLFRTASGVDVYEEIAPEAVANYEFDDVIATFNHDFGKILGRTGAGTLKLTKTSEGLEYEIETLPNTTYGNDLKESLQRGDVSGSSFMFTIADGGERWEKMKDGSMLRTITAFDKIIEVGPVVSPAYADTTAAQRSLDKVSFEVKDPQTTPFEKEKWRLQLLELEMKNL